MIPYRILIVLGVIASVFSSGLWIGYSHERAKFEEYRTQIAVVAEQQKQKVEMEKQQHEQITNNVISRYRNAFDSLHNFYSSSGSMSSVPSTTSGTNEAGSYSTLVTECQQTTIQLNFLQEWVKEQYSLDHQ